MFIHLNCHTAFSLKDSIIRNEELIQRAVDCGMPALGICDFSNLFNVISFYTQAREKGIKPIIGTDILMQQGGQVSLIAMNNQGYKNIIQILSIAYTQHRDKNDTPHVPESLLKQYSEGLICLCGAYKGVVSHAIQVGNEAKVLKFFGEVFKDRFYLEIRRCDSSKEEEYLHQAVSIAKNCNYPLVATNAVRFMDKEDYEAHEARICIQESTFLRDVEQQESEYTSGQYFRTTQHMQDLFQDIPSAVENSCAIAILCNVTIKIGENHLPHYSSDISTDEDSILVNLAQSKIIEYLDTLKTNIEHSIYTERLNFELEVIKSMGFSGYFLIVMDFISWARSQDIPVGPGRGSGAGSLVAFVLGITKADPIIYNLLFERFLNPERVNLPDFDIDFCESRRDEVISYVSDKYGQEKVSQIITFSTMAARAVVRDVARVQGKPYAVGDRLAKLIDSTPGIHLEKALEISKELRDLVRTDNEAQEVWSMALKLEGLPRNPGTHAGGIVIAPRNITDFSPLYQSGDDRPIPHFNKDDLEKVGLVKFDLLVSSTLTMIHNACKLIKQNYNKDVTKEFIYLEDRGVYKLVSSGHTTGIFQLESHGMQRLIKSAKPSCFEDIVALIALFRPGPLDSGMAEDYVQRKVGKQKVAYPDVKFQHDLLKPILSSTYGVVVYQEQVMQIAQVLGGYSLGDADILRRAMGKKKPEEMERQREIFTKGAIARNIDAHLAKNIFDIMQSFAGYGFNRSHSVCYALVSYQSAYLKQHYPTEFFSSALTINCEKLDRVLVLLDECKRMKLQILSPDINASVYEFSVIEKRKILYGLGAIKGVGKGVIACIIEDRLNNGAYIDIYDFTKRLCGHISKNALESFIYAGAFDNIDPHQDAISTRSYHISCYLDSIAYAAQYNHSKKSQQGSLLGMDTYLEEPPKQQDYPLINHTRLALKERSTLGWFKTIHPFEEVSNEVSAIGCTSLEKTNSLAADAVKLCVCFAALAGRKKMVKQGVVVFILEDRTAKKEAVYYRDDIIDFNMYKDKIICARIKKRKANKFSHAQESLVIDGIQTLEQYRIKHLKKMIVHHPNKNIKSILEEYIGGMTEVIFKIQKDGEILEINLGNKWHIKASDILIESIGRDNIEFIY